MELDCVSVSSTGNRPLLRSLTFLFRYSQIDFYRRCVFPNWNDWNVAYTKKGITKMRASQITRIFTVAFAIVGAYRLYKSGVSAKDIKAMVRNGFRVTLSKLAEVWALVQQ